MHPVCIELDVHILVENLIQIVVINKFNYVTMQLEKMIIIKMHVV